MPTPQELLDDIHAINIGAAWDQAITDKERTSLLKLIKQKMKLVRQRLKLEQEAIKKRWDGRNKQEAETEKLQLIPYDVIDLLLKKIDEKIAELIHASEFKHPLPTTPRIGTKLLEDFKDNYYSVVLGSEEGFIALQEAIFDRVRGFIAAGDYGAARSLLHLLSAPKSEVLGAELQDAQFDYAKDLIVAGDYGKARLLFPFLNASKTEALQAEMNQRIITQRAADFKRIQQDQLQKGRDLKEARKVLEDKKDELKSKIADEPKIISVTKSVNSQKGCANFLGILMVMEVVGLCAALRGFSSRPGTPNLTAAAGFLLVCVLTFLLWGGVNASFTHMINTILKPYLAALAEIKTLDTQINGNEIARNQAKTLYDQARDGLRQIAEQRGKSL